MSCWADRFEMGNPVYEAERQESRWARDAMSEMERAHFDEEMHH